MSCPPCPSCGAVVAAEARFCESCGAALGVTGAVPATPQAHVTVPSTPYDAGWGAEPVGDAPISAPTRRPAASLPDPPEAGRRPCAECGGEVGPDRYCTECGTKAPTERDHFVEQPASWVAGVCDRALRKNRNEDAMALLAGEEPGSRAVLVVLDGVSNSIDSDVASLAGARAAREVLRMPLPVGMATPGSREAAVRKVLTDAAAAANTAIVAVTDPDSPNPASATFTVAVLEGVRISWGNIGDSRCYWLPDAGEPLQLTVDDSLAQLQMASGVPREVAEAGPQAHAITKWLGRDSEDPTPTVGSLEVDESGWLLACSDGLWNYASTPQALREQVHAAGTTDPAALAHALVRFANDCGGQDNITVALARVEVSSAPLGTGGEQDLGQDAGPAPETAIPETTTETAPAGAAGGEPSDG
ncbi:protein phosphatase 2C domain-containing protein [Nocardioides faecalis]|uniref:protein phosphatase 2C domain-containing protein n=1 Tax=Nocardioides faecalis TaxID=2803858 RepID=UPI0027DAD01D|nr:protein phosphatase 2C domain-containing protein [Nocardioides faecalis]